MMEPLESNTSILVYALGVVSFLVSMFHIVIRPFLESKRPILEFPMHPHSHWLLGHGLLFRGKSLEQIQDHMFCDYADNKGRTGFWLANQRAVVMLDADDTRLVLKTESHKNPPILLTYHAKKIFGEHALGFINGQEWKFHRTAVTKSFNSSSLLTMRQSVRTVKDTVIVAITSRMVDDGTFQFDIEKLMRMVSIDILGLATLSQSFHCVQNLSLSDFATASEYVLKDVFRRLEGPLFNLSNQLYFIPTSQNRIFQQQQHIIKSMVQNVVREHKANPNTDRKDLLDNLILAHEEAKERLPVSEDVLADVIRTLLFAGFDTVSTTMAYTLFLISSHPQVEQNCIEEIKTVGLEDPDRLIYIKAAFDEALRIYAPSALGNFRCLRKDLKLHDGVVLPANTVVLIPAWAIHRYEKNFPRALEYHPERWVKRDAKTGLWLERDMTDMETSEIPPGNRGAHFGFSQGARNCPGAKYAQLEGVIVLSGLLKDLKFESLPGYQLEPVRNGFGQKPKGGIPMKVTRRQ